ncbi:major royal jelly family protein [Bacillus toyonensis]|uniref:major royal jelly family protein n=2 Tax=Bacillus toyonensis TaxID=155322 RepID=UPI0020D22AD8|nr:major royal jelly family protein [Bacillus toyonensis]
MIKINEQNFSSNNMKYGILFNWNHLDWNFTDYKLQNEFYKKQYWKKCIPSCIKLDKQGNFYVSVPRWAKGIPATMNKIVIKDNKPLLEAFPNWEWNKIGNSMTLQSVLGYEIDEFNRMWLLDQGHINSAPSLDGSQKLVCWDLTKNELVESIRIPNEIASYQASLLNDLVVDNKNGYIYITDSGMYGNPVEGGIIIYNMKIKQFRRVLHQHKSTQDYPNFTFTVNGKSVWENNPIKVGADGIALSADRSILYYCPLTGRNLYSIHTDFLKNFETSLQNIEENVKFIGNKYTNTDGMAADNMGNIYYTMIENQGIGMYNPKDSEFKKVISDNRMLWVDSISFDNRGNLIFNTNRINEVLAANDEIDWEYQYNFIVWKMFIGENVKSYLYHSDF